LTGALLTQVQCTAGKQRIMTLDFRPCGQKIANRGICENSCTDIYRTLNAPLYFERKPINHWCFMHCEH